MQVDPDRGCLNALKEVEFLVPHTGSPAVKLEHQKSDGVTLNAPVDWY